MGLCDAGHWTRFASPRVVIDSVECRAFARHEANEAAQTISFSETIAFLDVQVNHITKDVGH